MRSVTNLTISSKQERREQVVYNFRKVPASEFTSHLQEYFPLFNSAFDNAEEFITLSHLLYKKDLRSGGLTRLLGNCTLEDIDREQFDARVMYFIIKCKNKITSCITSYNELKQLPYPVITAILCNPHLQLEQYIKTPEQLIELLQYFDIPSLHFELVIDSIKLPWFMNLITTEEQLTAIVSRMSPDNQSLFLDTLDQDWLANLTTSRKNNIVNSQSTHFTPPLLREIFLDENITKVESFISLYLDPAELNFKDESFSFTTQKQQEDIISSHSSSINSMNWNWKKVGLFALTGSMLVGMAAGATYRFKK